jgi:hypothetical protein
LASLNPDTQAYSLYNPIFIVRDVSMRFLTLLFSFIISVTSYAQWTPYPQNLIQFDYSGDKLQQYWPQLSAATGLPWPDANFIVNMMKEFPKLADELNTLAKEEGAPIALKATLKGDYQGLASAVQQVWRLHFQGQYQQAYQLGMSLGPAGVGPALYAKLIHTTHLVHEAELKEANFLATDTVISDLLPHAKNYTFLIFGDSYQKARRLELMSTTAATASGLLGPTQEKLNALHKSHPNNPLYSAMLAGIDAGIIERVGNFVGNMTYGADEDRAIELFQNALLTQPSLAVLYNEFAQVILRLDDSDYDELLLNTLNSCDQLEVYSAEEALNQNTCRKLLSQIN